MDTVVELYPHVLRLVIQIIVLTAFANFATPDIFIVS